MLRVRLCRTQTQKKNGRAILDALVPEKTVMKQLVVIYFSIYVEGFEFRRPPLMVLNFETDYIVVINVSVIRSACQFTMPNFLGIFR